jgi:Na+/H+ antiporter NhaC
VTIVPFISWQLSIIEEEKSNWIKEAFMLSTISSMLVAKIRGMKTKDIIDGFIQGCQSMTIGAIVLGLAITLGLVAWKLNTADYLIHLISDSLSLFILPAILTILCMIVAFSTGTAFGTYAVVFPIAIPLAFSINPDPIYIKICFGAVLGGTVFGDQCSPISDTTIVSSMFTGCDLMDHVKTQFPFAIIASLLSILFSTACIFFISN